MTLPTWLNQEAWSEWVQFRKEIKKKLVQTTINRQLKFLEKHKADHILILEQSIQNGWQGLFKVKKQQFNQRNAEVGSIEYMMNQEKEVIDVTIEN